MDLIPMSILGNMCFWNYENAPDEFKVYMFPKNWVMFISDETFVNALNVKGGCIVVLKTKEEGQDELPINIR